MTEEVMKIVEEARKNGIPVSDEEAVEVCKHCMRKMILAKVEDMKSYLPLMFGDELKNYMFRKEVNRMSLLMMCSE